MRAAFALIVGVALCAAPGVAMLGCSDLDNGSGRGGGSVLPNVQAPPRPGVEITSPARASFLYAGPVAVNGRATASPRSASPVRALTVQGQAVPVAPDGSFQTILTLTPGVNVIQAVATDSSGATGSTAIGVVAGDYKPLSTLCDEALALRINDGGLSGVEKIIEEAIAAIDLSSLGLAPIYDARWFIFSVEAYLKQIRYGAVSVQLDAKPDGLHMVAAVANPVIDLDVVVNLGGGPFPPEPVSVAADRVELRGRWVLSVQPDGKLDVKLEGSQVDLPGLRVLVTSNVIQVIEALLRTLTRNIVEDLVQKSLDKLKPIINPFPVTALNGTQMVVDIRGNAVGYDDTGFEALLKVGCTPAAFSQRGAIAPGSFSTPGATPALVRTAGVQLTLDDDGLNRIAHGLWATGGLAFDSQLAALLPSSAPPTGNPPPPLTAKEVLQILPELYGEVPESSPVSISAEAHLPPIFKASAAPDFLSLDVAELIIDVKFDRGQGAGFETGLKVAAHVSASVELGFDANGLWLQTSTTPRFSFDVIDEPMGDIDDRRIEVALGLLLTPALPHFVNKANVRLDFPHVNQLSFFNAQAFADGPALEHVTLISNLSR